jgi:hypothetical protein
MRMVSDSASSPLVLSEQIAGTAQGYAGKLSRHHEAVAVLQNAPALVDRALSESAVDFVPAFTQLGQALLDLEANLVDAGFRSSVLQPLGRIHHEYRDLAKVTFPMPGQSVEGGPASPRRDQELKYEQAAAFVRTLPAVFEVGPRKLGAKAPPPQVTHMEQKSEIVAKQFQVTNGFGDNLGHETRDVQMLSIVASFRHFN